MKKYLLLIILTLFVKFGYSQYCSSGSIPYNHFVSSEWNSDETTSSIPITASCNGKTINFNSDISCSSFPLNVGLNNVVIIGESTTIIFGADGEPDKTHTRQSSTSVTINHQITSISGISASYTDIDGPVSLIGNPTGGTFSGSGVSNGTFNPSVVGVGNYTIRYDYSNSGCTFSTTKDLSVVPGVRFVLPFSEVCKNGSPINLSGGSPVGGKYYIDSEVVSQLTPSNYTVGSHIIDYEYNGSIVRKSFQILAPPAVSIQNISDLYTDSSPISLSGGSPGGGTYYIDGSTTATLNPAALSVGSHTLKYLYSNGKCSDQATTTVNIRKLISGEDIPSTSYCSDANDLSLYSYAGRSGGTFYINGNEIVNGVFSPRGRGVGSYVITYKQEHFVDEVFTIDVLLTPTVTISAQSGVCVNGSPVSLTGGSPGGGSYYVNGVQASTLNPASYPIGFVNLKYTYQAANGCIASANTTKEIKDILSPSISAINPMCANGSPITLNQGSPVGGIYSINGNTVSQLDPSRYTEGDLNVKYQVTHANGCKSEVTRSMTILPIPTPTLSPFSSICDNASPLTLTGGSPSGGTYSSTTDPNVVASGTFYPSLADQGTYIIRYTVQNAQGCSGYAEKGMAVLASTTVKLPAFADVCSNGSSFSLAGRGETPGGGDFYLQGNKVTSITPSALTPGTHTVTYSYQNANGCTSQDQKTLKVNAIPTVSLNLPISSICTADGSITLAGGLPEGGTYYVDGKAVSKLDPSLYSPGTITVIYTVSSNGCSASASGNIVIKQTPSVSITGTYNVCKNGSSISLSGGLPEGGTYYVDGISKTTISPSVLNAGLHTLQYTYSVNGCSASQTKQFEVYAAPTATLILNSEEICKNGSSITLSGGSPAGGTYYVDGIAKTTFDPSSQSLGNHTITYKVTNSNGCIAQDEKTLTVNPVTSVSFSSLPSICKNASPLTLTGALPLGGTYSSGNSGAVSGGKFYPSVADIGTSSIRYTYTNNYGCTDYKDQSIVVLAVPTVSIPNISSVCQNGTAFDLTGASPSGGNYTIDGKVYSTVKPSDFVPGSHKVTYTYQNADGCSGSAETSFIVKSVTNVSLSDIDPICSNAMDHVLTEGSPSGGIYLLGGSQVTSIKPSTLGVGTFTLTYKLTNADGCTDSKDKPVRIKAVTPTSISPVANICQNGTTFDLNIAGPAGGTYYVDGVENTQFDPTVYQPGVHSIKYVYTNNEGCVDQSSTTATVLTVPKPTLSQFSAVYLDGASFVLSGGLPSGGTYSVDGVAKTTFNPVMIGEGDHSISYQVTNTDGCSNSTSQPISVIPLKVPAIIPNKVCCVNSKSFSLGALDGGAYYYNGITQISGAIFDPSVWGAGVHTIMYKKPSFSDISFTVTVRELPVVSIAPFSKLCQGGVPYKLSGKGQPYGGQWSGTGVMGEYYVPDVESGDYVVTYTYADSYGCAATTKQLMTVQSLPAVSLQSFNDVCRNGVSFALTGGQPSGGTYSVDGVSKTTFNPANYQPGVHEISYSFTTSGGCTSTVTRFINVIDVQLPALSDLPQVCSNSSNIDMVRFASPTDGNYSCTNFDPAIAGSTFYPSLAGEGTFTIRYTVNKNGCTAYAEKKIVVLKAPSVQLTPQTDICSNAPIKFLTGGSPATGNNGTGKYLIDGQVTNTLNPSTLGAGSHLLRYNFESTNGCSAYQESGFSVLDAPNVTIPEIAPLCNNAKPVLLSGALPLGGIYYVNGQQSTSLDPSLFYGGVTVSYKYDQGSGCIGTAQQYVKVNQAPVVNLSPITNFCVNDERTITLNSGFPSGGQYFVDNQPATSVSSVLGSGKHTITYNYSDANSCSSSKETSFSIYSVPEVVLPEFDPVCENSLSFQLKGGFPTGGTYYVDSQLRTTANPSLLGSGVHTIDYQYTTSEGCKSSYKQFLKVNAKPLVTLNLSKTDFCQGGDPVKLSGGLPEGGTYYVDGIQTATFEPSKPGTHVVMYVYNGQGCEASASALIYVNSMPVVSIETIAPLCLNSASIPLWQGIPAGGQYLVNGQESTRLDPAILGAGNHKVDYIYKSSVGCNVKASTTVVVNPLPEVKLNPLPNFCQNAASTVLNTGIPSGGTYYIDGRQQGTINPNSYQAGIHTLSYIYTDARGCTNQAQSSFSIFDIPSVALAVQPSVCQDEKPIALSGGFPTGGTIFGESVINQVFYPGVGPGNYQINYKLTDNNNCQNVATRLLTVNKQDRVTLDALQPVCQNASPFTLSGGIPTGGTYYINGVASPVFIPSAYEPGIYTVKYEYSDQNNCSGSASRTITVLPIPKVSLAEFSPVCENGEPITLSTGIPTGGTWTGDGVMNGKFYPSLALPGTRNITYQVSNLQGCSSSATGQILVYAKPAVSISAINSICQNEDVVFLSQGKPSGGDYLVDGAKILALSPGTMQQGNHTVIYQYSDTNGCTGSASTGVVIKPVPLVQVSSINDLCQNSAVVNLTNSGYPTGGVFLINGEVSTKITPSALNKGENTIKYTYTNSYGCSSSSSRAFNIVAVPEVTVPSFRALCQDAGPLKLSGAIPADGEWTGESVVSGSFYPAVGAGTYQINYKVTDAKGCSTTKQTGITVVAAPKVTLDPIPSVCQNASSFTLSGGNPTGGAYFVNGKESKIFVPSAYAPGTYSVDYIFANGDGCQGKASRTITVLSNPTVSLADFSPVCENGEPVTLSTGIPTGGTYLNNFVAGGKFYPDKAKSGIHTISYSYTAENGCTNTIRKDIEVKPISAISLPAFQPVCKNANSYILSGAIPAGGTYSVDGTETSVFVPANYISGYHTISYNYKNQNGCTSNSTAQIQVFPVPVVELPAFEDVCNNASDIKLKSGYPAGGTYYVEGVKSTLLIPSDYKPGSYKISYSVSNDYGCSASVSADLRILQAPEVKLPTFKKLCANSGNMPLIGATPSGGTWTGDGIINQVFQNSTGEGKYTVTYTYKGLNGCTDSKSSTIEVLSAQTIALAAFNPVCQNASSFTLSGGNPTGGTYLVNGIATQQFNPSAYAAGSYDVIYQLINEAGCVSEVKKAITVLEKPEVSLSIPTKTCQNVNAFTLSGGLPTGGDYYIDNKKAIDFNPGNYAAGDYPVTYVYTNKFGCSDSKVSSIKVLDICPAPQLKTAASYCPNNNIELSLLNLNDNLKVDWYTTLDGTTKTKIELEANEKNVVLKSQSSFTSLVQYTDLNGCKSALKEVYVKVESLSTNITANVNQVKQGDLLKLSSNVDQPNAVKSYLWEFSDGTVSNEKDAWKYFNFLGNIDVKLYVETLTGCQFLQTAKNFINVLPQIQNPTESDNNNHSDKNFDKGTRSIDVTIFPNPTPGEINLLSNTDELLSYRILSQNGSIMLQGKFQGSKQIQLGGASGMYLVQILDSQKIIKTERIIKK